VKLMKLMTQYGGLRFSPARKLPGNLRQSHEAEKAAEG
jgi:hypothetical protein